MIFLFQAEDGIRDLVRSRGLGDVYKRQARDEAANSETARAAFDMVERNMASPDAVSRSLNSVSYTHLTLPTSDLV